MCVFLVLTVKKGKDAGAQGAGSLSGAWNMEAATGLLCALETVLETVWRGRRDLALEGWGHLGFGLNKRGE